MTMHGQNHIKKAILSAFPLQEW